MNTLKALSPENKSNNILIKDYRSFQYKLLPNFMQLIIKYVSKQNNNYLRLKTIDIENKFGYNGIYNSDLTKVAVECDVLSGKNAGVQKQFIRFFMPTLIDNTFFYLNGNYYVPSIYILDKPISVKKNSIKIFSLFNSITIYVKDQIATFTGVNIPIHHFLHLFLRQESPSHEKVYADLIIAYKLNPPNLTTSDVITYFSNKLDCEKTREAIIEYFENLFFDDYTMQLYTYCYGVDNLLYNLNKKLNLADLIRYAIEMNLSGERPEFIDLASKRFVFLELLISTIFKRIGNVAMQAARGFYVDEVKMDQLEIVKNFNKHLHGNYLYDISNLFSAIPMHKASLVNPASENPPSTVSNIHTTYRNIVDPCVVSNSRPGETIQLVSDAMVDAVGQIIIK